MSFLPALSGVAKLAVSDAFAASVPNVCGGNLINGALR